MSAAVARASLPPARRRQLRWQEILSWIATHSVAIVIAIAFTAPFVFTFFTAMMDDSQALTRDFIPRTWHPENFLLVFQEAPLLKYAFNTVLYAVLATAFLLLSSVPGAYALSKVRWKWRSKAFYLVIIAMLLPAQVTAVPLYVFWAHLGLTGTLWPLILPNLFGDAFSVFLIRQFMVSIPQSYVDAARIDGCSEPGVLWRVILPMARPGIAAAALFSFLRCWNDYFGPFLYTGEVEDNWTLAVGIASFRGLHQVQWNLTMTATILVTLPIIVLFFFAQKQFIEGIKFSGVKG